MVSVDFHVGQYAKIVEGMKRELEEWKAKAGALAEENSRLKEEVSPVVDAFNHIIGHQVSDQLSFLLSQAPLASKVTGC